MEVRGLVRRVSDGINRIVRGVVFLSTAAFTLLLFAAVIFRYVLKHPLIFSVEISKLLFVWSAFLALTVAYKEKLHIRFEFMSGVLRPLGVRITELLIRVSGGVFFVVLLVRAVDFTRVVWPTFFPVLHLSQGWLYVSVIVSMAILVVHSVDLSLGALSDLLSGGKAEEGEGR